MNAPVPTRAWWASECERLGTDWQSLGQVIAHLVTHLAPCPTCERKPCQTPSFCERCRDHDQERTTDMPQQFDNTNRGVLFNERANKETDNDGDYAGSINIEGRDFWLSGWIKTSKKGLKFLSLSAKTKTVDAPAAEIDIKDDIPF
jgi:hypothetical protein